MNEERRDAAAPELAAGWLPPFAGAMSLERLDEIAAVLERSASWFLAPPSLEPGSVPESEPSPGLERELSLAAPQHGTSSKPRLGKKERRDLERKQRALATQRAGVERRERRQKRAQRRSERLGAREPVAQQEAASHESTSGQTRSEASTSSTPTHRKARVSWAFIVVPLLMMASIAVVLAWLVGKK